MIKRLYQAIAILSVGHMAALMGVAAFLFLSGRLTPRKLEAAAAALREYSPAEQAAPPEPSPVARQTASAPVGQTAEDVLARARQDRELFRQYAARELREIEDRTRLADLIRLEVIRQQEKLAADRQAFLQEQERIRQQAHLSGFAKELEALASVSPKKRKDVLMGKKDADALRLLMEMEARQVKQVIEACKTAEETAWIGRLLEQMHNLDANQAGERGEQASAPPGELVTAP